jgi:hypothetical protein
MNLLDKVNELPVEARIPALRAIANNSLMRCIGLIRQDMREKARAARQELDETTPNGAPQKLNDLDQRNQADEDNRRETDELLEAQTENSFKAPENRLLTASKFHAIYDLCADELGTGNGIGIAQNAFERARSPADTLHWLMDNAQPVSEDLIKALVVATGGKIKAEDFRRMHELQSKQDREELAEFLPEIKLTLAGFAGNGYEDAIEDISVVDQYQLGVAAYTGMQRAWNNVFVYALRSRRLDELSKAPIIETGLKQIKDWVSEFEGRYTQEIYAQIENGRNIRTLEDVATN